MNEQAVDHSIQRVVFNHVGLCVGDLERSRHFYEQAFSFEPWWELQVPDIGSCTLLRLAPPLGLRVVYLVRDGLVLELLHFADRRHPPGGDRTMDERGLTHLSLAVADMDEAMTSVRRCGGQVLADTSVGSAVMVRDPDGQLIEITSWAWRHALPPLPATVSRPRDQPGRHRQ